MTQQTIDITPYTNFENPNDDTKRWWEIRMNVITLIGFGKHPTAKFNMDIEAYIEKGKELLKKADHPIYPFDIFHATCPIISCPSCGHNQVEV